MHGAERVRRRARPVIRPAGGNRGDSRNRVAAYGALLCSPGAGGKLVREHRGLSRRRCGVERRGPKLIEYPPGILERTEALIFFAVPRQSADRHARAARPLALLCVHRDGDRDHSPAPALRLPDAVARARPRVNADPRATQGHLDRGGPGVSPVGTAGLGVLELLQFLGHLGDGLEEVGDQAVVGDGENRRLLVLVDRDDDLGILHPGQMLDRA